MIVILFLPTFGFGQSASQTFCNETPLKVSIAIAYPQSNDWITKGWFVAKPGECTQAWSSNLHNEYLYYRGEIAGSPNSGYWSDEYLLCTHRGAFTIKGYQNCEKRGFERSKFAELSRGSTRHSSITLTNQNYPRVDTLAKARIAGIQFLLNRHGYRAGDVDGILGEVTRKAAQKYLVSVGLSEMSIRDLYDALDSSPRAESSTNSERERAYIENEGEKCFCFSCGRGGQWGRYQERQCVAY